MNTTLSDDTLRDARAHLLARGAELRDRVDRIHADLRREREPLPGDAPDAAIQVENDEVLQALEESAQLELARIERALARLDRGLAVCESCGNSIEARRLEVIPHATTCGRCARDA